MTARERLAKINCVGVYEGDDTFMYAALLRALDALEMYSGSIGSDASKALADINALAARGETRPSKEGT